MSCSCDALEVQLFVVLLTTLTANSVKSSTTEVALDGVAPILYLL